MPRVEIVQFTTLNVEDRMKRLALIPLILLATAAPSLAENTDPSDDFVAKGTMTVGNPANKKILGITETGSPCMDTIDPGIPPGTFNGLDGSWVKLGGEAWYGATAKLTSTPKSAVVISVGDVDAWFYDEACALIGPSRSRDAYHMATSAATEWGTIPRDAEWVVVDLADGVAAEYTFTVFDVIVAPQ